MTKPIKPSEVTKTKYQILPNEVFEAFNELIAKDYSNGLARVGQQEVVNLIKSKLNISSKEVYCNNYLDIEEIYEDAGWDVSYDKPGFNESYPASWIFRAKGNR